MRLALATLAATTLVLIRPNLAHAQVDDLWTEYRTSEAHRLHKLGVNPLAHCTAIDPDSRLRAMAQLTDFAERSNGDEDLIHELEYDYTFFKNWQQCT
jgi:hypothetical protein